MYKIYSLVRDDSGEVIYVGRTKRSLLQRWGDHATLWEAGEHSMLFNDLYRAGVNISIHLLEETDDPKAERRWQHHYWLVPYGPRPTQPKEVKQLRHEGMMKHPHRHSDKTKEKISLARRRRS